jgi:hypothetical protein
MSTNKKLIICPDFGGAYVWYYEAAPDGKHSRVCGFGPWGGKYGIPKSLVAALERWQRGFERASYVGGDAPLKLDWRRFHAEGLGLARRLKEEMGEKARVIYVKPIEDPDHKFLEHQEILLDGEILDVPGIG